MISRIILLAYDGDDGQSNEGQGQGGAKKEEETAKKFSQADVNKLLAENKRNLQKTLEQTTAQLEELKKSKGLSEEQQNQLTAQIEQLNNQMLTKEEQAKREKDKLEKAYSEEKTNLLKERDYWKNNYASATITRSIQDAAIEAKAFNPGQLVALIGPNTKLIDVLGEDGKPTGELTPQVSFQDTKDGKPITLALSVREAVKRMRELPDQYGNLFESGLNGGLGGNNTSRGKEKSPAEMNQQEYEVWRKKRIKEQGA